MMGVRPPRRSFRTGFRPECLRLAPSERLPDRDVDIDTGLTGLARQWSSYVEANRTEFRVETPANANAIAQIGKLRCRLPVSLPGVDKADNTVIAETIPQFHRPLIEASATDRIAIRRQFAKLLVSEAAHGTTTPCVQAARRGDVEQTGALDRAEAHTA